MKFSIVVTCYNYEPWHYRYMGRPTAAKIRASGLTLRQYLWRQQNTPAPTPTPTPSGAPSTPPSAPPSAAPSQAPSTAPREAPSSQPSTEPSSAV